MLMQAVVPPGYGPGSQIQLATPDGQQVQIEVPQGVFEGQSFQFMAPAPSSQPVAPMPCQPMECAQGTVVQSPPVASGVVMAPGVVVAAGPMHLPPGGTFIQQQFIGPITLIFCLIMLLLFWPATAAPLSCPCDVREVYLSPDGSTYTRDGRQVGIGQCCGHPCA